MMYRFQIALALLSLLFSTVSSVVHSEGFNDFIMSCGEGEMDKIKDILKKNPDWINESAKGGETCLHVAGIHGQQEMTKFLLGAGADPNLMSQIVQDPESDFVLDMHALSWHIFGGHVESAQMMLEHGADPNKPMDSIMETGKKVTVLDLLEDLIDEEEQDIPELQPFLKMKSLLLEHGAKHHDEL